MMGTLTYVGGVVFDMGFRFVQKSVKLNDFVRSKDNYWKYACVAPTLIKGSTSITRGNDLRLQKYHVKYDVRKFSFANGG